MDNIFTTAAPQGEADAAPATEGQAQTAAQPEAAGGKTEPREEPKKPVDVRKLKGRDKVEAILKKKPDEKPSETEAASEEEPPKAPDEPPKSPQDAKKHQTVKERFKELTTQRNEALSAASEAFKERDKAIEALEWLQKKQAAGQQLTQKEMVQEALLEQRLDSLEAQRTDDLRSRIDELSDPDAFRASYKYYAPILSKHSQPAMQHLMKLDNYHEVLDTLFNAVNNGQIDLKLWLQKPVPVLINDISLCSKTLKEQKEKQAGSLAETAAQGQEAQPKLPAAAKKELKPSITPDLKKEQSVTVKQDKSAYEARLDRYRVKRRR